jgi:hypothetical protein
MQAKATSGEVSTAEEQGLDVFGQESDWRIIRFMTYRRP